MLQIGYNTKGARTYNDIKLFNKNLNTHLKVIIRV